jgi:uncharacterized metal-binding protein YceD (DUF177 family)
MSKVVHRDFVIPIKGLSVGKHEYAFAIDSAFIQEFGETLISEAALQADVVLEKEATWIKISGTVKGKVVSECDRCLEDLEIPVNTSLNLIVKFVRSVGEEESDDVMILDPSEAELDLSQFLYDYICLSLPLQRVHPKGKCNPLMLNKLKDLGSGESADKKTDSPFEKLKDLLN